MILNAQISFIYCKWYMFYFCRNYIFYVFTGVIHKGVVRLFFQGGVGLL